MKRLAVTVMVLAADDTEPDDVADQIGDLVASDYLDQAPLVAEVEGAFAGVVE